MFSKRNISFICFAVWIIIKIILIKISKDENLQYVTNCLGCFQRGVGSIKHKIMNVWLSLKSSQIPFLLYMYILVKCSFPESFRRAFAMPWLIRRWLITHATFSNVSVTENALRQRQKMFIEDIRRSVNVGSLYGKWPGSETVNRWNLEGYIFFVYADNLRNELPIVWKYRKHHWQMHLIWGLVLYKFKCIAHSFRFFFNVFPAECTSQQGNTATTQIMSTTTLAGLLIVLKLFI